MSAVAGEKRGEDKPTVRITQQFRESHNMTYELDCSGTALILRFFPLTDDAGEWRIEARTTDATDATIATATAPTRAEALARVAEWVRSNVGDHALGRCDWPAIATALSGVRAI